MNKTATAIVSLCVAICAILLTVLLGFYTVQVVSNSFGSQSNPKGNGRAELNDPAVNGADRNRAVDNNNQRRPADRPANPVIPLNSLAVFVADDDMEQAAMLAAIEEAQLSDRVEELLGNRNPNDTKTNPRDLLTGENKPHPLRSMSDEEKNRVWWEIAEIAQLHPGDEVKYTLTIVRARSIARKYQVSVLDVFNHFREGANASWRTITSPLSDDDENDDERSNQDGR